MFYCDSCAVVKGLPLTKVKSFGNCDVCDDLCDCNETFSIQIERPKHIPMNEIIINTEI
jgi:hypothetical protein